ncbi:hypothetical protein BGX31_011137 [Mortierella sp. GBA43]|nr:hypothetical protein BGX31_011137 [Mortierella sp. GBA43]
MGLISLVHSSWALSYAALSTTTILLAAFTVNPVRVPHRTLNIVMALLSNHTAELGWTIVLFDAAFAVWLSIIGATRVSTLIKVFHFFNIIKAAGLLYLFKESIESKDTVDAYLKQLSNESKKHVEVPGPQTSEGKHAVQKMALDVYRPNKVHGGDDRPVFVYIHGGGWTHGNKRWIGPIVTELVSREWVVVSVDYRLAPTSPYPAQLIDCKRALRWIKDEIRIFGGNPNNIVVGGDSAGGHLAAMLALTQNAPEFQPGFENVDTTVKGCAPLSAALDLIDVNNEANSELRTRIIKEIACREGSPESAENLQFLTDHSPIHLIKETSVPFFVLHGERDSLAPVQKAREFVQEFKKKSAAKITYLEIHHALHAFHAFPSPRAWYATIALAEWLSFNFDPQESGSQAATTGEVKEKVQVHELVEWGWSKEE